MAMVTNPSITVPATARGMPASIPIRPTAGQRSRAVRAGSRRVLPPAPRADRRPPKS